jgi:hypothetical protein
MWEHLKGIAFPELPGKNVVDILIGADNAELTLSLEEKVGEPGDPVARKTPLGCSGHVSEGCQSCRARIIQPMFV